MILFVQDSVFTETIAYNDEKGKGYLLITS